MEEIKSSKDLRIEYHPQSKHDLPIIVLKHKDIGAPRDIYFNALSDILGKLSGGGCDGLTDNDDYQYYVEYYFMDIDTYNNACNIIKTLSITIDYKTELE